jgi:glycosyltransferase involved in cell wall biosynthesis
MIDQLGLRDHVRMLGCRDDVARLLAASDVAILTSISEGIPLTLIEAMAAGLPVVATRVGGVGEVVDDNRTGLLAPSGDSAALSSHLLRLATDPALRLQMGRLGRARSSEMFSEESMHGDYRDLLSRLTSPKR